MLAGIYLTLVVVTAMLIQQGRCQGACPLGFYGHNCEYMCHCDNVTLCIVNNSDCLAGKTCAYGYFGPECQYLDLCARMHAWTPGFIKDCDDTTCNPHPQNRTLEISFFYLDYFGFFRIVVNNASSLNKFNLTINRPRHPCTPERRYPVSATSVDVICGYMNQVDYLRVTGEAVGYLCSIHVSAGRNVALKQRTIQSSNSSTDPELGVSSNAVDGSTRNIYDSNSSCSQTDVEMNPYWKVFYDKPIIPTNMEVYNRDVFQDKLGLFMTIDSYHNQNITTHRALPGGLDVYRVPFPGFYPLTHMAITITRNSELTLCEVEVYGEVWCEDGIWGLRCDKPCRCLRNESCHVVTGACSTRCLVGTYGLKCAARCSPMCIGECSDRWGLCKCGPSSTGNICYPVCTSGKYGPNCSLPCPAYCRGVPCDYITGHCNECPGTTYGYTCQFNCSKYCSAKCNSENGSCSCMHNRLGRNCEECPGNTYGELCQFNCSMYCMNKCHSENGNCNCMHDRTGPDCADCPYSTYGEECQFNCSEYCSDKCDSVNGSCLCLHERIGLQCEHCPDHKFGETCSFDCPLNCDDRLCNMTTGICFSCIGNLTGDNCTVCPHGYYGELCEERCSPFCRNRLCDQMTHKCFKCVRGFKGDYCLEETEQKMPILFMILLLLPLITMICLCCIVGAKAKDNPEEEE